MKTYVTTCPKNIHLLADFLRLTERFYPVGILPHVADPGEAKSDQLCRLLESIDDEYLILLEEDFYFIKAVDLDLLKQVCDFCWDEEVDRFTLQSKNAYSVSDWLDTGEMLDSGHLIYQAPPQCKAHFGLDASVWKREFLLSHLGRGMSDQSMEQKISPKIARGNFKIYALDIMVMDYRDAMRGGKQVIKLCDSPLRLVANPGNSLALYPNGDCDLEELIL